MYKEKKVLCVIPARAGSKGLKGKNIKELLGKPLIAYSIKQAIKSRYIDRVIVSTEDSNIAKVSEEFGAEVPFMRPEELSVDDAGTTEVLLHAIDWLEKNEGYEFDIMVLLHVTSPLRSVEDIEKCIEMLVDKKADSVFSVTEAHRNPYFNMVEMKDDGTVGLIREGAYETRQSAPEVFDMNASIYVWWKDILKEKKRTILKNSRIYLMPKERSVDIDDETDFEIVRMLLQKKLGE